MTVRVRIAVAEIASVMGQSLAIKLINVRAE